jgi:molybdopterin converting factor small subunit
MQLEDGARAREALTHVRADPRAASLPAAPLLAVNAEYASGDLALTEGDEVAIIPPAAGG